MVSPLWTTATIGARSLAVVTFLAGLVIMALWFGQALLIASQIREGSLGDLTGGLLFTLFEILCGPVGFGVLFWWCIRGIREGDRRALVVWLRGLAIALGVAVFGLWWTADVDPMRLYGMGHDTLRTFGPLWRLGVWLLYGFGVVWVVQLLCPAPPRQESVDF